MSRTTLPPIDSTYPLDRETMFRFRKDGHACLPAVLSASEVPGYRSAIQSAAEALRNSPPPLADRDVYGQAFLKFMNIWSTDEEARRFVLAKRFARVAAELLGVNGVRIYHDQALFKEPGGGPTPWHQDQYYWPVDTDNTVTMWMPLVDITDQMGMLTFASGSHREGYLGTLPISEESERVFQKYVDDKGFSLSRRQTMSAGDATFHYGWTLHSAPSNESDTVREVMTVIYAADGCRVTEPVNENQERDITRWMPGARPGDLVATKLNPLAYEKEQGR